MSIAQSTRMQAYQLRNGGTPARLAILRMIAADSVNNFNPHTRLDPADWRSARTSTLKSYAASFGALDQGLQDGRPIWYCHTGESFRNERDAHDIIRNGHHKGWYTDTDCRETAIGIVGMLTHGRYIAGYRWTSNDERVYWPEVFTDENDAAHAADSHAEVFAENARDYSERFDAMQLEELNVELRTEELQKSIALRHRAKFGGKARVIEHIQQLREARETLASATAHYEKGE